MAPTPGKLDLGFSGQAFARTIAIAMTVGGGLGVMWFAALAHRPVNARTMPTHLMISVVVAAALTVAVVLIRQPNGAKLTWDAWGMDEWDGEGVRVSIPFSKLYVGSLLTLAKRKHSFKPGVPIGSFVTFSDQGDRRICVSVGTQLAWLSDRRCAVDSLNPLLAVLGEAEAGPVELGRARENALVGWWVLGIAGYVAAALALGGLIQPHAVSFPVREVMLGATALFVLRALQPFIRWVGLKREDARFGRAQAVTLESNEGTTVHATAAGGQRLRFDVGALNHPDARVETRRGPAFVVLENGVPLALETEGVRRARGHRKRALLLEAGLRVAAGALLLLPVM